MKLSILIPTYNRKTYIYKNLKNIYRNIIDNNLEEDIQVIISDNFSSDGTYDAIKSLSNENIKCLLFQQNENIGSVRNAIFLLSQADTKYIMFLGDDDYLHKDYLKNVIKILDETTLSLIVPSNKGVGETGEEIGFSRDINIKTSYSFAGFDACLKHSWRGHQMSGLVFRRDGLLNVLMDNKISNMYLCIFMVSYCAMNGDVLHLTDYPVCVTRPPQKDKGWSYGNDGLISEIFDNYKKLPCISYYQRFKLELKILDEQYWRYIMYIKLGIFKFIKAVFNISIGGNTTLATCLIFPIIMPFFLMKRILLLLITGELIKTLNRTVDI